MSAAGPGGAVAEKWPWLEALPDAAALARSDGGLVAINSKGRAILGADANGLPVARIEDLIAGRSRASFAARAPTQLALVRADGVEMEVSWSAAPFERPGESFVLHVFRTQTERVDFRETTSMTSDPNHLDAIYQIVFDQVPVGLLHFDARGVITACNEAFVKIIGSSKPQLVGLGLRTLTDARIVASVRSALDGERAHYEGEYHSVTAKKVTPVRIDFSPVRDGAGAVIGGVGIIEDITARRDAELALRRSETRLAQADRLASVGILAAGVAHEINNPLTYVLTSLDHLRRQVDEARAGLDREASARLGGLEVPLANAREGAERVRAIVRDLRTFSRSDPAHAIPVDVERVMDTAINLAASTLRARARLVRDYAGVANVIGEPSRLGQVFVNLLVNAAQSIPEGHPEEHEIRVVTRESAESITIDVEDTGTGVGDDLVDRIFEPFVTSKPPGEGTGLGLSICHGIVKNMGGEITLERSDSRGSSFRVRLPRARGTSAPPPSVPNAVRAQPERRLRVLVIDDEPILASTLRLALAATHDVSIAHSGTQGLEVLAGDDRFDVVLCDLMMPDRSGIDVYETIEKTDPALASRFVFMTGGTYSVRAEKFFARVKNPRLEKPFSIEEINALLRRAVPGPSAS